MSFPPKEDMNNIRIDSITLQYTHSDNQVGSKTFFSGDGTGKTCQEQFIEWLVDGGFYTRIDVSKSYILTERVLDRMKGRV